MMNRDFLDNLNLILTAIVVDIVSALIGIVSVVGGPAWLGLFSETASTTGIWVAIIGIAGSAVLAIYAILTN